MGNLSDYLDALAEPPLRGFGTVPSTSPPTVRLTLPSTLPPSSSAVSALLDIFRASEAARIDAQMWTLDSRWLGSAQWADMRMCVRKLEAYGPLVSTPVAQLPPRGCRGIADAPSDLTCLWGFWRIDRCDLDTASTLAFQFPRYLWAQSRMRELLRTKPTSATAPDAAAAWAWKAAQLISVLWWSTNVRFDNPNAAFIAGGYKTALASAGLIAPEVPNFGVPYDGAAVGGTPYFYLYRLTPRVLNAPGYRGYAPTRQNDFGPGNGPLPFMYAPADRPRASQPDVVYRGFKYNGSDYRSDLPLGLTAEQVQQVKLAAYNYATASADSDALRWSSTRAFNDWWFRATWSWDTNWRPLPGLTYHNQPVVIGSARVVVEDLARQLTFYADATKTYVAWMQSAMQTFNLETPVQPTSPAAIDFVNAKFNLMTSINSAAQRASDAAMAGAGATAVATGDATGAMVINLVVSVIQTVISLIASSVPLVGALMAAQQQLGDLLINIFGGAIGNVPCPAFPFIRVMAPRSGACDLSTETITASLLGISSNARWPVAIGGQTRLFVVDGKALMVRFESSDTTADLVARRINAAAALVGLGTIASVRSSQVHVEGRDPGQGPARATGGTACSLGFPGPCTAPPAPAPGGGSRSGGAAPSKSSGLPLLVGGAVLLRFLLG